MNDFCGVLENEAQLVNLYFFPVRIPLRVSFAITGSSQDFADVVFVRLQNSRGDVGWGECAPLPAVTGDTVASSLAFLAEHDFKITSKNSLELLHYVQFVLRNEFGGVATSALTALEMAALDLHSRERRIPLHEVLWEQVSAEVVECQLGNCLKGRAGADFLELISARNAAVELDITVPSLGCDELQTFWQHFERYKFRKWKVKVNGFCLEDDYNRVCLAWERACEVSQFAAGGQVPEIVLDGNQGFSARLAIELVEKLQKKQIYCNFFEQPHKSHDFAAFSVLSRHLPIPLCLDESVKTHEDLLAHFQVSQNFWVNLKTMKSGIREALLIGKLAKGLSLPVMIGGMMETDLSMSCSLHLVRALGGVDWADLDTPFFLKSFACTDSPFQHSHATGGSSLNLKPHPLLDLQDPEEQVGSGCYVNFPQGPGLGVTVALNN